jgi:hypothetical protein
LVIGIWRFFDIAEKAFIPALWIIILKGVRSWLLIRSWMRKNALGARSALTFAPQRYLKWKTANPNPLTPKSAWAAKAASKFAKKTPSSSKRPSICEYKSPGVFRYPGDFLTRREIPAVLSGVAVFKFPLSLIAAFGETSTFRPQ